MSNKVAGLTIRVDSKGVDSSKKGLSGLASAGNKAEKSTNKLTDAFKDLIVPVTSLVSLTAGLNKFVEVSRQFDVLSAGLETATGSAENAAVAFEALEQFAATTPFTLDQSIDGFNKLVNLGLNPSERALRSYGDTASAMGKDLSQMIEAVADASTGEFERLKEFGIKASSQGDQVSFTFRGVTTTVAKNAAEIEEHLISLGENNFAGAMANRMDTLDGALSNLQDTWDATFRTINEQGAGDFAEKGVRLAIDALTEFNNMLASGELIGRIDAISSKFDSFGRDIATTLDIVNQLFSDEFVGSIEDSGNELVQFLIGAFRQLPENIRGFIQIMTVELASFIDRTGAYGEEILENLSFWEDETFDLEARLKQIDAVRQDSINLILQERDALVSSFEEENNKVTDLRAKYDELNASKAGGGDVLGQFGVGAAANDSDGGEDFSKQQEKRLERIQDGWKTEQELLQEKLSGDQMLLVEAFESERIAEEEFKAHQLVLAAQYENDLATIEGEGARARIEAEQKAQDDRLKRTFKGYKDNLRFAQAVRDQDVKSALLHGTQLLQVGAQRSEKLFKLQQTAALANAAVTLPSAVLKSFEAGGGYPWGLIPAGLMLAEGLSQIQAIRGQSFGGGGGSISLGGGGGGAASPLPAAANETIPVEVVEQQEQRARVVPEATIVLPDITTGENLRGLIDMLNEQYEDGYRLKAG